MKFKCTGCGEFVAIPGPAADPATHDEALDIWDLPLVEGSRESLPPKLPNRTRSGNLASYQPQSASTSSDGSSSGTSGLAKVLLIVLGVIGGVSLLLCAGGVFILRSESAKKHSISAPAVAGGIPWTKYVNKEAWIEVEFPDKKVNALQNVDSRSFDAEIPGTDTNFRIEYSAIEEIASPEEKLKQLHHIRDVVVNPKRQAVMVSTRDIQIGEHPAIQIEYKKSFEGNPLLITSRYVLVKNRFYQLIVARHQNDHRTSEVERFFNSFRIITP